MYTFLGGASQAFSRHFMGALRALGLQQPPSALGPAVIIFHETRNTRVLNSSKFVLLQPNQFSTIINNLIKQNKNLIQK